MNAMILAASMWLLPQTGHAQPDTFSGAPVRSSLTLDWRSGTCRRGALDICAARPWRDGAPAGDFWRSFGLRVDVGRSSPRGVLKVARLFIDDMDAGSIGPFRVRISISIE